jgi:ATP-binding cassette subfamily F protein uup
MPRLHDQISAQEAVLADPGLYGRDAAAFERTSHALDAARRQLAAAEEEWLELEGKREALESG